MFDIDEENGTRIVQLTDDPRPTDDIYGEHPYASADGSRIAVRFYAAGGRPGGLSFLDLEDGSQHTVIDGDPCFPAFHAWGAYFYCQEKVGGELLLRRWHYGTLAREDVLALPTGDGEYSYGTVSPDGRYYAVIVHPPDQPCRLDLFDLRDGSRRVLLEAANQFFKHEQFSLDGRNRILLQANGAEVKVVNLGVVEVDREGIDWLPLDAAPLTPIGHWPGGERYTPRCTGHEAWIGDSDRVFLSTDYDDARGVCLWSAATGDELPTAVCVDERIFGHVSASRCGRYWIADAVLEEGIPIYMGAFGSGSCRRLVTSYTQYGGPQWSHTHPYLTADNRWLIYTSSKTGLPQVYGAEIAAGWLAEL